MFCEFEVSVILFRYYNNNIFIRERNIYTKIYIVHKRYLNLFLYIAINGQTFPFVKIDIILSILTQSNASKMRPYALVS